MNYRHLVDPELLPTLDAYPGFSFSAERLPEIREAFMQRELIDNPDVDVSEHLAPGASGGPQIRVVRYASKTARNPSPVLLHIHGGGFVLGKPEMNDAQSKLLAAENGCVVLSVDYRLAPETPFPGAVEDCYAALKWLHAEAKALGVDPSRVVVGGESAGGGHAAALTLLNRDRDNLPIALQYLTYPMLDHRTGVTGDHIFDQVATWTAQSNRFGWAALLGGDAGNAKVSPYASPSRAQSLAGLPPAFISVGALDLFADETVEYARRLIHDAVATELHVYPGAFHGFNQVADAHVSQCFQRDWRAALERVFEPGKDVFT
ncbi:MAG: alpha/beta hydrolase [Sphingomonadaceae bacterium]|nr:alpha/beta hydrolase [Sphingomonadaceae bacterium]